MKNIYPIRFCVNSFLNFSAFFFDFFSGAAEPSVYGPSGVFTRLPETIFFLIFSYFFLFFLIFSYFF